MFVRTTDYLVFSLSLTLFSDSDSLVLPQHSYISQKLRHSTPIEIDKESRVLAIGPILNEWTQSTTDTWKKRYKKVFTNGKGFLKTFKPDTPASSLLDEINYKTLTEIVTYFDFFDDDDNDGEFYVKDGISDTRNSIETEPSNASNEANEPEFKTHSQPVPILVGVQQGQASQALRSLWRKSAPPMPEWRANMQRLIDATPPVSANQSITVTSSSFERLPSTFERDNNLMPTINENEEEDLFDARRSSAASFVTANEEEFLSRANSTEEIFENDENLHAVASGSLVPIESEDSTATNSNQFYDAESEDEILYNDYSNSFDQSTVTPRWQNPISITTDHIEEAEEDEAEEQPNWDYPAPSEFSDFDNSSFKSVLSSSNSNQEVPIEIFSNKKANIHTNLSENRPLPKKFFENAFKRYLLKRKKGEIIRAEKLLVMVKGSKSKFIPPDFNENESVETRKLENWKEYVMVARKSGDGKAPLILQFYKNFDVERVNSKVEKPVSRLDIKLKVGQTHVKFYSTLDKTIVLWRSTMKGSLIYVFRSRSHESAMRWLALFRQALGVTQSQNLLLGVPDLGVTVEINLPLRQIFKEKKLRLKKERQEGRESFVTFSEIKSNVTRYSPIASYIFSSVVESLMSIEHLKSKSYQMFIDCHQEDEKIGLAWRRYDRLEWVNEEFNEKSVYCNWVLHQTHDLELRPMKAYPRSVTFDSGISMQEPMPVEGYLIRLTAWSNRGNKRKSGRIKVLDRLFYKMLYFHTHDNLLFFSEKDNAVPPVVNSGKNIDDYFIEIAPFKIDQLTDNVEWMAAPLAEIKKRDRAAVFEFQRRVSLVSGSDGFIDLCDVIDVRPALRGSSDKPLGTFNPEGFKENFVLGNHEAGETTSYSDHNTFEIVLNQPGNIYQDVSSNHQVPDKPCIIRLQAYNRITRDRWIAHLTALAKYWKRRAYEDVAEINETRERNLTSLHIPDEEMEQVIGENSPKWETASGEANPRVHRPLFVTGGRAIKFRGVLYGHLSSFAGSGEAISGVSFKRYYVVLDQSARLTISQRPGAGTQSALDNPSHYYRKTVVIDLLERPVYLYCGPLTVDDIGGSVSGALPRVYPDGWRSAENDAFRCFVLRFGSTKLTPSVMGTNAFFGRPASPMVFLARSRQERDLWVLALNSEIEKVIEFNKDINLT